LERQGSFDSRHEFLLCSVSALEFLGAVADRDGAEGKPGNKQTGPAEKILRVLSPRNPISK
jgi:hypothetical protein